MDEWIRIILPSPDGVPAAVALEAEPDDTYASQLKQNIDAELEELCSAFHADASLPRGHADHLYAIAEAKQLSVTSILTQILNDKKASLPFLLTQDNQPRPQGLHIELLDGSAESLSMAAHLANKPFKQALREMLIELNMSAGKGERGTLIMSPVRKVAEIAEKHERGAASMNIFDLNQATIVFESEAELLKILDALPKYFEVVYLDNKFKQQWEQAAQPPCLHLNLRMRPELLPEELISMLAAGAGWVVELQLTMRDFLDVKQRCHVIDEILRLRVGSAQASTKEEHKVNTADSQYCMSPLPRTCPKCGLPRYYVKSSQLRHLTDVSSTQKLVKKGVLVTMENGETEQELEVAYNLVAVDEQCRLLENVFVREVGLLTRLDHLNVLQILGVVRESNALGFVTEWMPQGSLWKCLQDPQERQLLDVWAVAFQLCDALVYVHSHDVVHIDLKSKNVLLARQRLLDGSSSLVAKLCNFGLSREINESTLRSKVRVGGTPNWQAPETWDAVDSFHPSADVYAFGGVLIELFGQKVESGCFPWMQERSDREAIKRQVKTHRAKPPELDFLASEPEVKALATDCLAFDPGSRPTMKKVKARLLAAHFDSLSFDPDARRILLAMEDGTLSFPNLVAKLQDNSGTAWPATVSFLEKYRQTSPCFEVALAMCCFFSEKKHTRNNDKASLQPRNEDVEEKDKTKENKQEVDGKDREDDSKITTSKNASELSRSSQSFFEVCERHMAEVVTAKFLAGWCSSRGTGGATRDEERAMRYYRQASAQGYPAAQFQLGLFYRSLRNHADEEKEAVRWFTRAAKQGHIGAQLTLVRCYQLGEGVGLDLDVAKDWLSRAATPPPPNPHGPGQMTGTKKQQEEEKRHEKGDTQGTDLLRRYFWAGECFMNGREVRQDAAEATRLYRLAAEQGCAEAQFNLGACYVIGQGVQQDAAEAARWYRLAAEQGCANSQFNLGVCYNNGRGVQQDDVEAARLYRLAAEQGHAAAQCNLGVRYNNGRGVQQDAAEAARLYRLAAEQGHANSQFNLGACYVIGRGVQQDEVEATRLYRLAAEQGHAEAQFNLGVRYDDGRGVQQDAAEAVRWHRLAAEQGCAEAQFNLGVRYCAGRGVQQDAAEAARWYRLAAEQGCAEAQFNLGVCYNNGRGVQQDVAEGARWCRLAAEQGDADAQCTLGANYYNGRGVQQDMTEAIRWCRLAAEQGHADAQCCLGALYCFQQGVQGDMTEAIRLFRLAADQGHDVAQAALTHFTAKASSNAEPSGC